MHIRKCYIFDGVEFILSSTQFNSVHNEAALIDLITVQTFEISRKFTIISIFRLSQPFPWSFQFSFTGIIINISNKIYVRNNIKV